MGEKEQRGRRSNARPPGMAASIRGIARKPAWTLDSTKPIRRI